MNSSNCHLVVGQFGDEGLCSQGPVIVKTTQHIKIIVQ